jgi:hypothetical protein
MIRRGQMTTFQERLDITERTTAGQTYPKIVAALGCSVWIVRKLSLYVAPSYDHELYRTWLVMALVYPQDRTSCLPGACTVIMSQILQARTPSRHGGFSCDSVGASRR